jgi:ATP-binding cassette subfamily C protein PrsD
MILVMNEGRARLFGPKDEVLARVMPGAAPPTATPLKVVAEKEGAAR